MSKISKVLSKQGVRLDVATLTKRGIKRVLLTPTHNVVLDGVSLEANKQFDITFPELNGTLPSYIQLTSDAEAWYCGCRVMELAGKGNANYFTITKENNNGVPT